LVVFQAPLDGVVKRKGRKMAKDKKTKKMLMRCEATGEDVKVSHSALDDVFNPEFRVFAQGAREDHETKEAKRGARILHRDCIYVSPKKNVRRFDTEKASFTELLDSIKAHGIVTPLIVVRSDEHFPYGYKLVAGFRRFEAATRAELDHVPCVLADQDDNMQVIGLLENLGREEMNPMEKASLLSKLQMLGKIDKKTGKKKKLSQRELAKKVGMAQSQVSDMLSLTKDVAPQVAEAVADGKLPVSKAAILKQLPPKEQKKQLSLADDLDVKELRKHVGKLRSDLGIEAPAHGPSPKARTLRSNGRKFQYANIADVVAHTKYLEDLIFKHGEGKKSDRKVLAVLQWVLSVIPEPKNPIAPPEKKKKPAKKKGAKKAADKKDGKKSSKKASKKADAAEA